MSAVISGRTGALDFGPVDRVTIAEYAEASGDRNPVHLDPEVAREAGFADVIAPGMLTMAAIGRLLTEWHPQARLRTWSVRFTATVPVDAVVRCDAQAAHAADGDQHVSLTATLADGTVILRGSAVIDLTEQEIS